MSLIDLSGVKLPGAQTLPETEADILAALEGTGYLLMPFNGLPVILAVSTAKLSAGACERITETRLEVMQKALREAGFKPGENVDLAALAQIDQEATAESEPDTRTNTEKSAKAPEDEEELPFDDEEDGAEESDPYEGEEDDPEDEEELPFQTDAQKSEKLQKASLAMKANARTILEAEIDAVMPAVVAWGIAGRSWGLPGRGDKPAREDVAGDTFLGRSLRFVLLDGFLRPILRGLPTQAAFTPEALFPLERDASAQEKTTELPSKA